MNTTKNPFFNKEAIIRPSFLYHLRKRTVCAGWIGVHWDVHGRWRYHVRPWRESLRIVRFVPRKRRRRLNKESERVRVDILLAHNQSKTLTRRGRSQLRETWPCTRMRHSRRWWWLREGYRSSSSHKGNHMTWSSHGHLWWHTKLSRGCIIVG